MQGTERYSLSDTQFESINIADNAISDSGMHAVKGLIASNCCTSLNLASNMISESGLNMVLKELTMNTSLESLDVTSSNKARHLEEEYS